MALAYLGLGSNLGNRLAFMRGGRDAICAWSGIEFEAASGVYETEPQGGPPDSPEYLNAVLAVRTTLSPRDLFNACRAVEDDFGRVRQGRWAPRTLDIDLLMYDALIIHEEDLQIPHPRLHERLFVLVPFVEIAPEIVHPQKLSPLSELVRICSDNRDVRLLRANW